MKVKFYLFGVLILFGIGLETQAQVSFLKKSMGNLGSVPKAGDVLNNASLDNVDKTTGTLKVGIPLYEIKVNDISVPITLNYSALGLKVGQEAGAAGMGWDLSAGGKILTNVNGKPDAGGISGNNIPSSWTTLDPYTNRSHFDFVSAVLDGTRDGAWDTYNYILPNGGGTYIQNGLTFPYDPLIRIDHANLKIKTTDGIRYNFITGDVKKVSRRKFYNIMPTPAAYLSNTWDVDPSSADYDLDSIVSTKYKSFVKFNYEAVDRTTGSMIAILDAKTRTTTSESMSTLREVQAAAAAATYVIDYTAYDQYYKLTEPAISQSKTEYIQHTRISNITYPNGRVTFSYGADILGRDVLETISIFKDVDGTPVLMKKYLFIYDNTKTYGHYLASIKVYDAANVLQNYWAFTYNDQLPLAPNVPSFAQDRWGFYNAQTANKTLLEDPNTSISLKTRMHYPFVNEPYTTPREIRYSRSEDMEYYGMDNFRINNNQGQPTTVLGNNPGYFRIDFANRDYSFTSAVKGTLQSVKTPTGGSYEYEYEPHRIRYNHYPGTTSFFNIIDANGGGIRVKSIIKRLSHGDMYSNTPAAEANFKKAYTYGSGTYENPGNAAETDGSGYVSVPGNSLLIRSLYGKGSEIVEVKNILLLSHPANNMVQYGGSYALYGSVTESLMKTVSGTETYGKTVYYSRPLSGDATPDFQWRSYTPSIEDPQLPVRVINPGVKKEAPSGIYGSITYSQIDGGFAPVEKSWTTFTTFSAPMNSTNKAVSFFGAVAGQRVGPFPSSPFSSGAVVDVPVPNNRGGAIVNTFNALAAAGTGTMDFFNRTLFSPEGENINYPNKYDTELLDLNSLSNCLRPTKTTKTVFSNGDIIVDDLGTSYSYGNMAHMQATKIATKSSRGDSIFTRIKYAHDYQYTGSSMISYMINNKLGLNEPIEEFITHNAGTQDNTEYLKSSTLNTFKQIGDAVFSDKAYTRKLDQLQTIYNNGSGYSGSSTVDTNLFKLRVSYDQYLKGNLHMYKETEGPSNVVIWGYDNQFPIAKVTSAANLYVPYSTDVAYTSFESADYGNWTYAGTPVNDPTCVSGRKVYDLAGGNITKTYTKEGGKFIISYWYKQGSVVNVVTGSVSAEIIKNRRGDWILAEREVSPTYGYVTVSGTGFIDELRYYPIDSQMSTYTYDPLIGVTGTFDTKGNAAYYEYDDSQRLKNIKDQQGNIIKSYRYINGTSN